MKRPQKKTTTAKGLEDSIRELSDMKVFDGFIMFFSGGTLVESANKNIFVMET